MSIGAVDGTREAAVRELEEAAELLSWALDYISDLDRGAPSDRLVRYTLRYLVEAADATGLDKVRADHAAYFASPAAIESGHIDTAPTDPREFAVDVIAGEERALGVVRSSLKHFIVTDNDAGIRAVYAEDQRGHLDHLEAAAVANHTLSVECGYCSAPVGRRCVSKGGLGTDPHGARIRALVARCANDQRPCPAPRPMDQEIGR